MAVREDVTLEQARRIEVAVCRLRFVVAGVALATAFLFDARFPAAALALAALPFLLNAYVYRTLRGEWNREDARRLARVSLGTDLFVAAALYALFVGDPHALPIAFVPLVVFQLAVRYGNRGAAAGLGLFLLALGGRILAQLTLIPGGAVRPPLIVVWLAVAAVMVAYAREFRAQERARVAALEEERRIAGLFRATIEAVLEQSGIAADRATRANVIDAVRKICDERSEEYATLAAGVADLLVPAGREFGLTRREQEIVTLLCQDYSYGRIASTLLVSPSTVRNHVHHIRQKLELGSREEIVRFAVAHALGRTGAGVAPR